MKTAVFLAIVLLVASIGGCSSPHPAKPSESPSKSESSTFQGSPTPTNPPPVNNMTLGVLQLSECTGFSGGTPALPTEATPGSIPPGWEKGPTDAVSELSYAGYECQRVHVDQYERGPIHIIWDTTGKANVPATCREKASGGPLEEGVNNFLVDDAEIAMYLHSRYDLPASYAEFHVGTSSATAPLVLHTWDWGPHGQPHSNLTLADDGGTDEWLAPDVLFWTHGQGVGKMVIAYDHRTGPTITSRAAHGTFEPPMLISQLPGGQLDWVAWWYSALAGTGKVTLFKDNQCKQPEP